MSPKEKLSDEKLGEIRQRRDAYRDAFNAVDDGSIAGRRAWCELVAGTAIDSCGDVEALLAEVDRATASLDLIREWATADHGGMKRPIDIWPGLAAALGVPREETQP